MILFMRQKKNKSKILSKFIRSNQTRTVNINRHQNKNKNNNKKETRTKTTTTKTKKKTAATVDSYHHLEPH